MDRAVKFMVPSNTKLEQLRAKLKQAMDAGRWVEVELLTRQLAEAWVNG